MVAGEIGMIFRVSQENDGETLSSNFFDENIIRAGNGITAIRDNAIEITLSLCVFIPLYVAFKYVYKFNGGVTFTVTSVSPDEKRNEPVIANCV